MGCVKTTDNSSGDPYAGRRLLLACAGKGYGGQLGKLVHDIHIQLSLKRNNHMGVFHFSWNRPEGWHKRPNFLDKTFGTFFLSTHLKHILIIWVILIRGWKNGFVSSGRMYPGMYQVHKRQNKLQRYDIYDIYLSFCTRFVSRMWYSDVLNFI